MVTYGVIMACYPVHRLMGERVGHMEHKWGYTGRCGYMGMLQPVQPVFENVLQYSTGFYRYVTKSDVMEGM